MPTDAKHAVFLLAHQDDEFGVFEKMHLERQSGRQLAICYFTTGVRAGSSPQRRNDESLAVLQRFGIIRSDVHFVGEQLGIADGSLLEHMAAAAGWLQHQLSGKDVAAVYAPVWEGGHPDHDCLCAVATTACSRTSLLHVLRHFALYHGRKCPSSLFRVLSPMSENGPIERTRIPWTRRFQYLRHCLAYPSQWRSWVGLLPSVALRLLVDGGQAVQPTRPERIAQRPHPGPLYYEKRRFASYAAVRERVDRLMLTTTAPT
jgi:LmbE family N-acetylglucosaminyl deacetylase